jgi:hypothetical protein
MVQSGLVGWWPLSEWDGRANDLSGSGMNGTVSGATQGVAGRGGLTGYSFIEADDISSSYNGPVNPDAISISFWARPDQNDEDLGYEAVVDNSRALGTGGGAGLGFAAGIQNANGVRASFGDGSNGNWISGSDSFRPNEWVHIVYNFVKGSHISAYVNGELNGVEPSSSVTGDFVDESSNILIAGDSASNGRSFSGALSDVRLYNRALNPSEVTQLYQYGSANIATPPGGSDSGAVSRYAFDDLSTGDAIDSWGSNDGTITGPEYTNNAIRGLAMEFDGNDYIPIGTSGLPTGQEPRTISVWVNTSSNDAGSRKQVLSLGPSNTTGENFDFEIDAYTNSNETNAYGVYLWSGYVSSGSDTVTYDGWTHIAVTYTGGVADNSNVSFYKNGAKIPDGSNDGTTPNTTYGNAEIGRDSENTGNEFTGTMDDLRIFNRVLSPSEIQQLYQWGTKGVDMRSKLTQH